MSILLKFGKNRRGRDFVVGDLHGHLRQLKRQLEGVDFDADRDRLFFVGDLVDRGPDSEALLAMIDQQVYITIVGNHEAMMIAGCQDPAEAALHLMNGGEWFYRLPEERQRYWAERARNWPWAIEIETGSGRVGLVHANLPGGNWAAMTRQLEAVEPARTAGVSPAEDPLATVARGVLWDRTLVERFYGDFLSSESTAREIAAFKARELERAGHAGPGSCVEWVATAPQAQLQPFRVSGIDSVYMGHSFVPIPVQVGDCHFLDSYRGEPGQMLGLVCISEP
ncbi:metallophosphoesterase [Microbulbifer yueqingensis]|uniref:Calcineurin-like phosphoesterase n=1 Tax=Microbulbifer yueqingensis TaxID=658219 RepID=A0A1G8VCT8_9GAMM|nr:metallophosphoesterase [Microbulbifer yueqingensis]SDJ62950.1 Calcineurin-like phosphoesterase [Microbulbifer yueqingensis]